MKNHPSTGGQRKDRESRFALLLISLILIILLYPVLEEIEAFGPFPLVIFILLLITGLYAMIESVNDFRIGLVFAVPAVIASVLSVVARVPAVAAASGIFFILFYAATTLALLRHVLHRGKVDADTIYGAVCIYLLLGILWGTLYYVIELLTPGSFVDSVSATGVIGIADFMYYSFVTLTTTGFGDICAVSGIARSFASFEAIAGTLFIAVLMARFVGLLGWGQDE